MEKRKIENNVCQKIRTREYDCGRKHEIRNQKLSKISFEVSILFNDVFLLVTNGFPYLET